MYATTGLGQIYIHLTSQGEHVGKPFVKDGNQEETKRGVFPPPTDRQTGQPTDEI